MNRVYFATREQESGEPSGPSQLKPRLAVLVEMAGGQAAAAFDRKKLGEPVKRAELLRGFERPLPDGSALRVQAFPIASPKPVEPAPQIKPEPKVKTQFEILQEIKEGTMGRPGVAEPGSMESLPMFPPGGFEPYRVRAWIDGRELREVVGQAAREEARLALMLLLLLGVCEVIWGARLQSLVGATRFLLTGPVFLLGALGVWKKWSWSVSLALVVAVADTVTFALRTGGSAGAQAFLLFLVSRLLLIAALWRLRTSGWPSTG